MSIYNMLDWNGIAQSVTPIASIIRRDKSKISQCTKCIGED